MQKALTWLWRAVESHVRPLARSLARSLSTHPLMRALSIVALLVTILSTAAGVALNSGHAVQTASQRPAVTLAPRPPAVAPALPLSRNAPSLTRSSSHGRTAPTPTSGAASIASGRGPTPAPPARGATTSKANPEPKPGSHTTAPAIAPRQAVQRAHLPHTSLSGTVLILDSTVTGGASSLEAQAAQALGLSVEVDDSTAWAAKTTTSDFAQYREIIFGDPNCVGSPDPSLAPAEANPSVWGPAVTGNVEVIGTDPVFHAPSQAGAVQLISDGIYFAALDAGHTGAYIDLSCYYFGASAGTDVPLLDAISTPGSFQVAGEGGNCPNGTHIVASSPALANLSDAALANWSCSTHESLISWPSNFQVLAINTDMTPNFTAPDGISGAPYILAASSVTPQPALSGPQTGPETYGNQNLAEHNPRNCACDPIDTLSGTFSHTFTDLSIPGRGVSLQFTRTYNAAAAAQNGPLGYGWVDSLGSSLAVDSSTGAVTVAQENGSAVVFNPDGSGGYTAASRVLATLVKNGDGSYSYTRIQDQSHFTFDATGRMLSESDRNGYTTTFAYNGSGQLTTVTDASGRPLTLAYDGSGHIATITDPLGRSVSYAYNGSGDLVTATDVSGGHWTFTYDSNHLMQTMTDPNGGVTTNIYDGSNRVIQQTDPMGRSTTFTYTAGAGSASSTSIRDPNGNISVDQYDNGVLVSETKGYGTSQAATWVYTYDLLTLGQESMTNPNGQVWKQTWDPHGNLATSTDPLARTTTYTYDALNDVTAMTDPLGVTTSYTYDTNGNLLSESTPLTLTGQNRVTTYTYGDAAHPGDVTSMTDPNGNVSTYTYDANGERVSSVDPLNDKVTDTYNAIGWKLTETSPRGNVAGANASLYTTTFTYDAFGDVASITDPLGGVTRRQYDADRNLIQTTDANGNVTRSTYDLDNEVTKTLRADGSTLTNGYDADGAQISQTDANGQTTTFTYDPLNRLVSTTDPLNRTTSYGYDLAGNRTSLTDPSGNVTTYSYDPANELAAITYSDGVTPNVYFSYDGDGQRTYMSDGTGATTYTFDSLHRLTYVTNGASASIAYGYDLKGQMTSITYPSGQSVSRAYDVAGRLVAVTDWSQNTSRFAYDVDGNLIREAAANGLLTTMSYDAADRISSITYRNAPTGPAAEAPGAAASVAQTAASATLSVNYARDAMGQITEQKAVGLPEPNQRYTYSALNHLNSVNATPYTYDGTGDLTQGLLQGSNATLSYDKANEVTSLNQAGGNSENYTYDMRGNRIGASSGGATTTYTFDQANRLTGYATTGASATSATYTYNGDGLRMSKTVGGATSNFTWQVNSALPLLLQDGANSYIYGPNDLPLEQVDATGAVLYFAQDQLGSTLFLTDSHGARVATYTYDAYGATTAHTGTATTQLQYAGQYTDAESGLLYLRARYYDPATSQFLSRDVLAALTGAIYAYANDNPLFLTDLTGLFSFSWSAVAHIADVVSNVATVVSTGADILAGACGLGAAIAVPTVVGEPVAAGLAACAGIAKVVGIASSGVGTLATITKATIDWSSGSKERVNDTLDVEMSVGGLIGSLTGATDLRDLWKARKIWQAGILAGWEGVDTLRSLDALGAWSSCN